MNEPPTSRATLLRDRNFTWLMSGGAISALGDQFTLIALPWLVLKLTGDPVLLGLAVALMGIPRAILILFGGALVDRHSPKRILMLTKHVNTVLLAVLAALVYTGHAHLPVVLALALGLSLASAFGIPAGTSMLPHAVAPQHLQAANGMMMALRQVTMLAGPLLAGLLFALAGDGSGGPRHMRGLAFAFGPPRPAPGGSNPGAVLNLAEVLWESIPARLQRRLRELCDEPDVLDYDAALSAAKLAVRRAGFFAAGDLAAALRQIAAEEGYDLDTPQQDLRAFVRDNPTARNLYSLALGAEYAHTRFQFGRGGR